MSDNSPSSLWRLLQGAACLVIVSWGVKSGAAILGPLLLGLMLAYACAPFPKWLMRRFKLSRSVTAAGTAVVAGAAGLFVAFAINLGLARLAERLPTYEEHLASLYQQISAFAMAHGIDRASLSLGNLLTPDRLSGIAISTLPRATAILNECLLSSLFALLFLMEMVHDVNVKPGNLAEKLMRHGFYSKTYVSITAKSAAINASINFLFLLVMGVDTPLLWSFLYFFLNFIPTLGFSLALIPPTFVTLLMYGWRRALLVAGGLILTNLIVDNVITPMFAKRTMSISFLEMTLSLVGWAFLLGLPGAIVAVPLTLALKDFLKGNLRQDHLAEELSA